MARGESLLSDLNGRFESHLLVVTGGTGHDRATTGQLLPRHSAKACERWVDQPQQTVGSIAPVSVAAAGFSLVYAVAFRRLALMPVFVAATIATLFAAYDRYEIPHQLDDLQGFLDTVKVDVGWGMTMSLFGSIALLVAAAAAFAVTPQRFMR